ncbi:hypothetical protein ACFUEJ_11240 [Gordonia sp. NPDC057258]|uniref:hypothetical protein n=1 Tax=unclassified Gordonia (in: high G+C Gram-positive bacteria) TaxID=2657482 RepID=UPI0036293989
MNGENHYPGLDFGRSELAEVMSAYYRDILDFILQPGFQRTFDEMMNLAPAYRPEFVRAVWLEPEELTKRDIHVPEGILIQTSAFGDRRPTLFVVKKFLPEKYHRAWENVNWTFNNEFKDSDVPRDVESAWRLPLKVSVQNALISGNFDLQQVPSGDAEITQSLDAASIVKSERRRHASEPEPVASPRHSRNTSSHNA